MFDCYVIHYLTLVAVGFVAADRTASPRYADREAATTVLKKAGYFGYPALYLAACNRDPECRDRCRRLPGGDIGPRQLKFRAKVLLMALAPYHPDFRDDDDAANAVNTADPIAFRQAVFWIAETVDVTAPGTTYNGRTQIDALKLSIHGRLVDWTSAATGPTSLAR